MTFPRHNLLINLQMFENFASEEMQLFLNTLQLQNQHLYNKSNKIERFINECARENITNIPQSQKFTVP